MTRIAPLLTLASVAVLGAGLFATNHLSTPPAPPVPLAAAAAPAVPVVPEEPAAPPSDAAAEDGTAYAGWTSGMDLTVAMTVVGDEVTAYVCDGGPVEVWLRGTAPDGVLDLAAAGGSTLTGTLDGSWAEGTVTIDGEQRRFTAEPIEAADAAAAGRGDVAEVAERAGMDY